MIHLVHSIQIVIVLYKIELNASLSYKTLNEYISALSINYELLIYNNSSEIFIESNNGYCVVNAVQNEMLAVAYNYALQRAITKGHNWLLLLDQDTCLTKEYFEHLNAAMCHDNIDVIIPKLKSRMVHLSPKSCCSVIGPWGRMKDIKTAGTIINKTIQAFNSAALITTRSLQKIGGFSLEFPLYELDYWVFYQLSKNNERFYLMDVELSHDLTMLDYHNKMTMSRYYSIIGAEYKYSRKLGLLATSMFKARLLLRLIKQILIKEKRIYIYITLRYLCKIK